jgi:DNA-binding transcriptional LysR family regulator
MDKLERRFSKRFQSKRNSSLSVGGSYALSASVLPELLGKFKKQYPSVDVVLRANAGSALEQMLLQGTLDLVVTSLAPDSSELISEPCMRLRVVAVAATGYPLSTRKELTLHDLEQVPLIIYSASKEKGITETFLSKLRQQGYRPKILMRCDSPEAIKTAVVKKLGVGILYEDVVKDGLARGLFRRVRIVDFPAEVQSYVVYHKHRTLSGNGEAFLQILRKRCGTQHQAQVDDQQIVRKDISVDRSTMVATSELNPGSNQNGFSGLEPNPV